MKKQPAKPAKKQSLGALDIDFGDNEVVTVYVDESEVNNLKEMLRFVGIQDLRPRLNGLDRLTFLPATVRVDLARRLVRQMLYVLRHGNPRDRDALEFAVTTAFGAVRKRRGAA